ncbi:MFS transporter [Mesoterricola silvestris]|uniref:MFS transporter n=1 Tax=Mesoterricola silvestris TaxID=2927979 RepID=A0AA48GFR3_9BACT|nr:MFS transporter [Mesoterricola silvestris]BDU71876.1 MFS transporter [Mesoterricola silvestris]
MTTTPMNEEAGRLGFAEKAGYALGDAASNFYWKTFEFFIIFFYTDIFGISAGTVGTMMLVTRVVDAVADPVMGTLADRTRTRWGHFRPYLVWFGLPLAAAGVLTFTTPALGQGAKVVYAYVTYCLLMLLYTAVNIPYSALMGVMTPNSKERTSLASFRFVGAFSVAVLVQYCTPSLAQWFGMAPALRAQHSLLAHPGAWIRWFLSKDFLALPSDLARGWQLTMGLYGLIAVALFALCFLATRERVAPPAGQDPDLRGDFRALMGSRAFVVMIVVAVAMISAFVLKGSVSAYYFKYYVHRNDLLGPFLVSNALAFLAAVMLAPPVARRFDKKVIFMAAIGVGGAIILGFWFAGPGDIAWIFALQILSSFVIGFNSPLLWAMFADTADDAEWRSGRRNTGLVFASAIFGTKIGLAVGAWITGILLTWFGYVANVDQTARSLVGIRLSMSLFPGALLILSALLMKLYPLDDRMMVRIEKDLKDRKSQA